MASLTTLARIPELLEEILQYLSHPEALNLAVTRHAFTPVCLRHVWTTLRIPYPGYGAYLPHRHNVVPYEDPTIRLNRIVRNLKESPWLQYTKCVIVGRRLTDGSPAAKSLFDLLESGKLKPNRVETATDVYDLDTQRGFDFDALTRFKRYCLSREQGFELKLNVGFHSDLCTYFATSKVTDLHLIEHVRAHTLTNDMDLFISLLPKFPNIRSFTWEGMKIPNYSHQRPMKHISTQIDGIQATILDLKKLRTMVIKNNLFHPSFFAIPPSTVTRLDLSGYFTATWWNSFASCKQLGNVKDLTITHICRGNDIMSANEPFGGFFAAEDDRRAPKDIRIYDLEISNLERFECPTLFLAPRDLVECLLHRNPKLNHKSTMELHRYKAQCVLNKCEAVVEDSRSRCRRYSSNAYTKKFEDGHEVDKYVGNMEVMREYADMLVEMANGDRGSELVELVQAQEKAKSMGRICGGKLKGRLSECIDLAVRNYTEKLQNMDIAEEEEEEAEEKEKERFMAECIRMFSEGFDKEVAGFTKANREAKSIVNSGILGFSKMFEQEDVKGEILETVADRLARDEKVSVGEAMELWTSKTMEKIEERKLRKEIELFGI